MSIKGWIVIVALGAIALSTMPEALMFSVLAGGAILWWSYYKETGKSPDVKGYIDKFFTGE